MSSASHESGQRPQGGFRLSDHDFQLLSRLVEDSCGIRLPASKRTLAEGRLRRRAKALGMADLDAYCRQLFDHGGLAEELVPLIDAITTNKTDFFREPDHFAFLRDTALPQLAEAGRGLRSPLKIWSAACSVGAEPYTLAMVAEDFSRSVRGFRYGVLATDICTEVLRKAIAGIFQMEMSRPIPSQFRQRYLMYPKDKSRDIFRIVPEIRQSITFGRLNLMDDAYDVEPDFDMIFCRNVLIYFSKQHQEKVLSQLCRHLRKGGLLFVGHAETVIGFDLPVKTVAPSVFQRG